MDDIPPRDDEIVASIGDGLGPTQLVKFFCDKGHPLENVIEALQRAIEREKITFNSEGLVVTVARFAEAA